MSSTPHDRVVDRRRISGILAGVRDSKESPPKGPAGVGKRDPTPAVFLCMMIAFLISCENATCAVPEAYREIFRGAEDMVESAEGWEPGALNLAQALAMRLRTPLLHGDATRLLIDLEQDGDLRWSQYSKVLPEATRVRIAERHEHPYRTQLRQRITEDLRRHSALVHLTVHTEVTSEGMVTLTIPPAAALAKKIAGAWVMLLRAGGLEVRLLGNAEIPAMAASLAREFPADHYAQIRLAVSQSFFLEGRPWRWEVLKKLLVESFLQAAAEMPGGDGGS